MKEETIEKLKRRLHMTASSTALWGYDKVSYRFRLRRVESLTLPGFLGIGAQKAGTNWLWENLRCHPDLFLPSTKELHYFNLHFNLPLATYATQFAENRGKLAGEITPAYSILSRSKIGFIRKIMPGVKLILVLRNPIDRAWSRAKMVLREPGASSIDLGRIAERAIYRALSHQSSHSRGDYLKIIDNWCAHFPTEQLHICFYDDISKQPKNFLEEIFRFLNVRCDVNWTELPYNTIVTPGATTPLPDQYRRYLENMYRDKIEFLYRRFGSRVESWRCD